MFLDVLLLALGLFLVLKGGDLFVDESIFIAGYYRVPRIVVGGTLVSIATTLPELVVSVTASWMGDSGIALGNAVGSAIANIGLIAGIVALMGGAKVELRDFRRRSLWLAGAGVLVVLFSWNLQVSRLCGALLFLIGLSYLAVDYIRIRKGNRSDTDFHQARPEKTIGSAFAKFLLGAILVIAGSRMMVAGGSSLALAMGIPSSVIGLTIIAVGTSLPELVTAVNAAKKGVGDLSIGNIVGANILNLSFITGASATIRPLEITRFTQLYSMSWMAVFIAGMILFLIRDGVMHKKQGAVLTGLYVLYTAGLVVSPLLGVK